MLETLFAHDRAIAAHCGRCRGDFCSYDSDAEREGEEGDNGPSLFTAHGALQEGEEELRRMMEELNIGRLACQDALVAEEDTAESNVAQQAVWNKLTNRSVVLARQEGVKNMHERLRMWVKRMNAAKRSVARFEPESFEITSPAEGVTWAEGSRQTVYWEWVGTTVEFVKLQLVRGGKVAACLTASTPNVGEASVNIPSLNHRADYTEGAWRIRISDTKRSNAIFAFSEPFTLQSRHDAATAGREGRIYATARRGRGLLFADEDDVRAARALGHRLPRNHPAWYYSTIELCSNCYAVYRKLDERRYAADEHGGDTPERVPEYAADGGDSDVTSVSSGEHHAHRKRRKRLGASKSEPALERAAPGKRSDTSSVLDAAAASIAAAGKGQKRQGRPRRRRAQQLPAEDEPTLRLAFAASSTQVRFYGAASSRNLNVSKRYRVVFPKAPAWWKRGCSKQTYSAGYFRR